MQRDIYETHRLVCKKRQLLQFVISMTDFCYLLLKKKMYAKRILKAFV